MDRLEVLVADIVAGGVAIAAYCDVTGHGSIQAAIKIAADTHGPIDILVNNAGNTSAAPVLEHDIFQWNKVIETNLTGSWVVAQEVAKLMAPRGRGSIINIASCFAIRTYARVSGYAASKAAIVHLTRNMAVELASMGIRVNAIAPGFFDTELGEASRKRFPERHETMIRDKIPMSRVGEFEELDGPLLLLASDAGSYMTGELMVVDGGLTIDAIG